MLIINVWFNKALKNGLELVYISKNYFLRKSAYLSFFETRSTLSSVKNLFLPKINNLAKFSQRAKYLELFSSIYEYFYVSKLSLLNFYYTDLFFKSNPNIFRFSCLHFNRFLKFNYWAYNYGSSPHFNLNNLKSRIKIHTRANNLRGYKMHLVGRFTRKQRAASYWFSRGKVPLNSITSFVDFAFFTLPLKIVQLL